SSLTTSSYRREHDDIVSLLKQPIPVGVHLAVYRFQVNMSTLDSPALQKNNHRTPPRNIQLGPSPRSPPRPPVPPPGPPFNTNLHRLIPLYRRRFDGIAASSLAVPADDPENDTVATATAEPAGSPRQASARPWQPRTDA